MGLFDNAVLLSVTISRLGLKRKVDMGSVDAGDADKSMLHLSKDLLESPVLDKIQKWSSRVVRFINKWALPSCFKGGVYLWPLGAVAEADAEFDTLSRELSDLVVQFADAYESCKVDAKRRLGAMFKADEYPSLDKVKGAFGLTWQFIEIGVPGRLESISAELFKREQSKAEAVWADAMSEAREVLREGLVELVSHAVDRLSPDVDGERKRFKSATIDNLRQFLDTFQVRNITDDADLAREVDKLRSLMSGVSVKQLKDSQGVRDAIRSKLESAKVVLSSMIEKAPARSINLSQDEWGDI